MEETVISEDDIPKILSEYLNISKQFVLSEDFQNALEVLAHSEELLEAVSSQGGVISPEYIISTLHNTAHCYINLKNLEKAASYLDGSLFNSKLFDSEKSKLVKIKYECRTNLQLFNILTDMDRGECAAEAAKLAYEQIKELVALCKNSCQEHMNRHSKFKSSRSLKKRMDSHKQYKLMESPHYLHFNELVTKAFPIFEYLNSKLSDLTGKPTVHCFECSVPSNFTQIPWVTPDQFTCNAGIQEELSDESLADKVVMATLATFYMFKCKTGSKVSQVEGLKLLKTSVSIAKTFMKNSPFFSLLQEEYEKAVGQNIKIHKSKKLLLEKRKKSCLLQRNMSNSRRDNSILGRRRQRSTSTKRNTSVQRSLLQTLKRKKSSFLKSTD